MRAARQEPGRGLSTFARLLEDPAVDETFAPGAGPVAIFAPHGGGIEPGTEEIARALAAACGAGLYVLAGRRGSGNRALHVASTGMPPRVSAKLDAALAACRVALAVHGHGLPVDAVFVSGQASRAVAAVAAALRPALGARYAVIDEVARIPPGLRAVSPGNFVNRPAGGGVQLELPRRLREEARPAPRGDALALVSALACALEELPTD